MITFLYIVMSICFIMGIGMIFTESIAMGIVLILISLLFYYIAYTGNKQNKIDKEKKRIAEKEAKNNSPKPVELTDAEKHEIEMEEQLSKIIANLITNEEYFLGSVVRHSPNNRVVSVIEGFTDTYRIQYEINLENKVIDEEETVYATTSRMAESRVERIFTSWAKEERLLTHPEESKSKRKKKTEPTQKTEATKPSYDKIVTSIQTVAGEGEMYTVIVCELKGLFYRDQEAKDAAFQLEIGSPLNIKVDLENRGLKVVTPNGIHLGYIPADLSPAFHEHLDSIKSCTVKSKDDLRIPHIGIETIFKN